MSKKQAIPTTGQGPPDKPNWTKRVICLFLPKRWHKYVTPEVIAAWNLSNYVTWAQAYALFHWEKVSAFFMLRIFPHLQDSWVFLKSVSSTVVQMFNHTP